MSDSAPADTLTDSPELDAIPAPVLVADVPPQRKSRSGTSGAERRRRAAASSGTPPKTDRRPAAPRQAPLEQRIREALETIGTLIGTFVDPYDGAVLVHNAPKAGAVLAGMAARKPGFARLLERLLGVGDNVDGLMLLAGMVLPILVHHGAVPAKFGVLATLMGTAPPSGGDDDAAQLRDLMAGMMTPPSSAAAA